MEIEREKEWGCNKKETSERDAIFKRPTERIWYPGAKNVGIYNVPWRGGKKKDDLIKLIFKNQHELDLLDERLENFCVMCGNYAAIRQNAHIAAEGGRARINMYIIKSRGNK